MEQDMLEYLPQVIIIDILLRLPFQTIMICRCVCRLWLSLIGTEEFIMSYFRKSAFPDGLALVQDETHSKPLRFLEFIDGGNSAYPYKKAFSFSLPHHDMIIHSSVDGLLFLNDRDRSPHFICNPVTCEYFKLPPQSEAFPLSNSYGFGVSKLTGQYKVVRLFCEGSDESLFKCEVYTVGTGSWRSIAAHVPLTRASISKGVFFNGNLHWLERNSDRILCFDLETEHFSTLSTPELIGDSDRISELGDYLYLCQCRNYYDNEKNTVIWVMNKNGDGKSWRKKCVLRLDKFVVPIKNFRDGGVLFAHGLKTHYHSIQTRTVEEIKFPGWFGCRAVMYTPSFLKLNTLGMENVSSF